MLSCAAVVISALFASSCLLHALHASAGHGFAQPMPGTCMGGGQEPAPPLWFMCRSCNQATAEVLLPGLFTTS